VEAALAQAQAELGIIPAAAAREITAKAHLKYLGPGRRADAPGDDRTSTGARDLGARPRVRGRRRRVRALGRDDPERHADRAALAGAPRHDIFLRQLAAILLALADLADTTKDMLLPGRTHGQHAVPANVRLQVAVWIDELGRHVERLRACEGRVFVPCWAAAPARWPRWASRAWRPRKRMAARLGMRPMPMPARTIGDHQAEYVLLLGMLAATSSKIGREVYTLMKQEFGELEEPVPPGTVGSSTMPQKRNPKLSQDIIRAAAQIRALAPLALERWQTEHEPIAPPAS